MYCARVYILHAFVFSVSLFDVMLQDHGKELMSCRGGQLLINHTFSAWQARSPHPPEAAYQYLVSILSPGTDNLLFFNQRKSEKHSTNLKECAGDARVDLGTSCIRSEHASTELPRPIFFRM